MTEPAEAKRGTMATATPEGVAEDAMIRETQWGAIRELRAHGKAIKVIARELDLDVKTVRKWVRAKAWQPRKRRASRKELDRFRAYLEGRAPEVGFNGKVLERELREGGWNGHYTTLSKYVSNWRKTWRGEVEPVIRYETDPGEQAQVDWGSTAIWIGEELVRIHVFTMVLGYSRRLFARAYPSEGVSSLLDGHEKAFAHFGGRCRTLLYDNPRTIVLGREGETVKWNGMFKDRMDFYGAEVKLCRPYRAQTKGKVENGVKYVKRNALAGKRFRDLEELNEYLAGWCVNVADERIHGTTHEKPSKRFERETLIPVDGRPPSPREEVTTRRVPKDAYVTIATNRYPVPFEWTGQEVTVSLRHEEIVFNAKPDQEIRHVRLTGKHEVARWPGEPRHLPKRPPLTPSPPRFDSNMLEEMGQVEIRPLTAYELAAEVLS